MLTTLRSKSVVASRAVELMCTKEDARGNECLTVDLRLPIEIAWTCALASLESAKRLS